MIDPIKLKTSDVPKQLRGTYTGRKFKLYVQEYVAIPADANIWDGGTKYSYSAVRLADGATLTLGSSAAPWDPSRSEKTVKLHRDIVVVLNTYFCGNDMGLTFYVHPDAVVKFLK